jgi:hypothetical protein
MRPGAWQAVCLGRRMSLTSATVAMTSLPLVLDDHEPIGIILRAGRRMLRPARIWAYCWFTDEAEAGDHTHRHLPEHID